MTVQEQMKKTAGEYAVTLIEPGMTIGIGTGTTVYYFIKALAQKISEGLVIRGVATSKKTEKLATQSGIPLVDLNEVGELDIAIDGADEIDPQLQLIKGGGGSLLQEKIVATASRKLVIIADADKAVPVLGKFPLPVEVIPFGWNQTAKHIAGLNCKEIVLRQREGKTFVSDHGHFILDCHFEKIENQSLLTQQLNSIAGVVENGLFLNIASSAILGQPDGTVKIIAK